MGLAALCVRRPVFATMLIMALVVLGVASFRELGIDQYPKIDLPIVTVTTTLPGASAEEMESEVTKTIEEAVNTIQGVDELRATTVEGVSRVIVTFVLERDIEQAAQDVRDKVSVILRRLPEGVNPPVIEKVDPDASPIMSISVSGGRSMREITEIADKQVKQQLESVSGIGQVLLVGGRTRAIQIEIDAEKMNALGLGINQVSSALQRQNVEIPSGRIDQGKREVTLRTLGRITSPRQFSDLIVRHHRHTRPDPGFCHRDRRLRGATRHGPAGRKPRGHVAGAQTVRHQHGCHHRYREDQTGRNQPDSASGPECQRDP